MTAARLKKPFSESQDIGIAPLFWKPLRPDPV